MLMGIRRRLMARGLRRPSCLRHPLPITAQQPADPPAPRVLSTSPAARSASSPSRPGCSIRGASRFCPTAAARGRARRPAAHHPRRRAAARRRVDVADAAGPGAATRCTVAVHPKFAENKLVYVSYPKNGPKGNTLAVARGRLQGSTLTELAKSSSPTRGRRAATSPGHMMFGPDNSLYVMVGDRDRLCCTGTEDNSLRMKAQALDNHVGKTLRLKDDGGVPPDNPFVGKAGAKPEIFTYGHRNGYGLSFNPADRRAVAGGDRTDGRRRSQHPACRPQLRMAARLDRPELHRHARVRSAVVAARAWTTRGSTGCRRSARRASCSTRATSSRSGRTACSSAR